MRITKGTVRSVALYLRRGKALLIAVSKMGRVSLNARSGRGCFGQRLRRDSFPPASVALFCESWSFLSLNGN